MNQMRNGIIQMGKLCVSGHRPVAEQALKRSKCHRYDHPWEDNWSAAADFYRQALRYAVSEARGGPIYPGWEGDDWTFACFFQGVALRGWDLWNESHGYGPGVADHFKWTVRVGEGFLVRAVGDLIYGGWRGAEVLLTALRKCYWLPDECPDTDWRQAIQDVAYQIHLAEGGQMGLHDRDWAEAKAWLGICLKAKKLHDVSRPAAVPAGGADTTGAVAEHETQIGDGKMPLEQDFLDCMTDCFFWQPDWSLPLLRRRACRT